ncbi:uncharacterized protein B0T15DRAFT_488447 [Chaetomium strumarium]|uniref:Uncharacterized protein n=1 Tax=Chaetomium strumarium TaxID=1170767 RepID=A0AAJ0M5K7_9PEZI|nr:hypothetical protein B0T15DRAFT_488447 [Chaetomium strumarium]
MPTKAAVQMANNTSDNMEDLLRAGFPEPLGLPSRRKGGLVERSDRLVAEYRNKRYILAVQQDPAHGAEHVHGHILFTLLDSSASQVDALLAPFLAALTDLRLPFTNTTSSLPNFQVDERLAAAEQAEVERRRREAALADAYGDRGSLEELERAMRDKSWIADTTVDDSETGRPVMRVRGLNARAFNIDNLPFATFLPPQAAAPRLNQGHCPAQQP